MLSDEDDQTPIFYAMHENRKLDAPKRIESKDEYRVKHFLFPLAAAGSFLINLCFPLPFTSRSFHLHFRRAELDDAEVQYRDSSQVN